jgi:hypothetical protein
MNSPATLVLAAVIAAGVAFVTSRIASPTHEDRFDIAALEARLAKLEKPSEDHAASPARDERGLVHRVEALEARMSPEGAASAAPGASPQAAPAASDADAVHREITVGLTTEPTSSEHRAALLRAAEHLVKSYGPPLVEKEFTWAARGVDVEARRGRVTPQEAADLAPKLAALPPGHGARPALAKAVAMGWGNDERLGPFLGQFGANSEPAVHQGILAALDDEHPSPAFSDYVLRIVREERDPAVLAVAIGLDRIEAAATAQVAPQLVQALEARIKDGTLDAATRVKAGFAIAVAGLRATDLAAKTLRDLAATEPDAATADKYRQSATSLAEGKATLKSLERLFEE